MNFDLLKDATRYYKENPKGVESMCRAFEEVRNEGIAKGKEMATISNIKDMMEAFKLTAEQVMDALKIPAEKRAEYAEKLSS